MRYKNFSIYVQRQINRLLRRFRRFARVYVNDIVIFFKIVEKHILHFRAIFDIFQQNNVFIKFSKTILNYFFVQLLRQKVNSFDLFINEKKLKIIVKLFFSRIFRQLKIYLSLTKWLREYVSHYVDVIKFLQLKKTKLLKFFFKIDNVKKIYSSRIRLNNSILLKIKSFRNFQTLLSKSFYLIYHDSKQQTFIDFDISKKFDFDVIIYYLKSITKWNEKNFSSRKFVESILFLSKFLIFVETCYWLIELKFFEIIWMLKKIQHLIEIVFTITIIYTNHDIAMNLTKQISMTIFSIDKFNLRLIRASNYI